MALTDKLTAIGNAIRAKTGKIRPLSLDEMVNEINTEWLQPGEQRIKDYVKDFYIQDDGEHYDKNGNLIERDVDWDDYVDLYPMGSNYGKKYVIYSYTPEGYIVLTARSKSKSYENLEWTLKEKPEGSNVEMHNKTYSDSGLLSGHSEQFLSCVLTGIDRNCQIYVDCGSRTDKYDSMLLNVYVKWL